MKNKLKSKINSMLIIGCLTIGFGLTSCKKECWNDFKKEISNCGSTPSDTLRNPEVKK